MFACTLYCLFYRLSNLSNLMSVTRVRLSNLSTMSVTRGKTISVVLYCVQLITLLLLCDDTHIQLTGFECSKSGSECSQSRFVCSQSGFDAVSVEHETINNRIYSSIHAF